MSLGTMHPSDEQFKVFTHALERATHRAIAGTRRITSPRPLSGGAVQETWAFSAVTDDSEHELILRRARGAVRKDRVRGVNLTEEATVVMAADSAGVPVPHVRTILQSQDGLGEGFIMDFIEGETIPRKILRNPALADLRRHLADDCGRAMAAIHDMDATALPFLDIRQPQDWIGILDTDYRALNAPGPVFEFALRWLGDNCPSDLNNPVVVHGDFRNGNIMVGPDGLRSVLDWEGVHVGDPHEELAYITLGSWRFGEIDKPVGGFGTRDQLFSAYEDTGGQKIELARVHFWEVAFTLNWGIQCGQMADQFLSGVDRSVERGAVGRRRSETEIDLLRLLAPRERNTNHA